MQAAAAPAPQYLKLKRYILDGIAAGTWPAHEKIPSEGDLTRHFQVSRMTANRALRELASEGVITRVQGVGSFVAGPKAEATMVAVHGIRDEIAARGQAHQARVLRLEAVRADAALAGQFLLPAGSTLFHSQILHSADHEPLQFEDRYVNPAVAPDYLTQDYAVTTPHDYLMQVAPLERAEHLIEAEMPDAKTARRLGLGDREPVLILHRRTWSAGRAASVARLTYPSSRFRLVGTFNLQNSS